MSRLYNCWKLLSYFHTAWWMRSCLNRTKFWFSLEELVLKRSVFMWKGGKVFETPDDRLPSAPISSPAALRKAAAEKIIHSVQLKARARRRAPVHAEWTWRVSCKTAHDSERRKEGDSVIIYLLTRRKESRVRPSIRPSVHSSARLSIHPFKRPLRWLSPAQARWQRQQSRPPPPLLLWFCQRKTLEKCDRRLEQFLPQHPALNAASWNKQWTNRKD